MTYRNNPDAINALVRPAEVHKDLFISDEIFELEMTQLFANTWVYVGHDSQVPKAGDFFTTTVGNESVVMIRDTDDSIRVLYNRCPHKGVMLVNETYGNAGRFLRCPYHAWSFRLNGDLLALPLKRGYDPEIFGQTEAQNGMAAVENVHNYRGFIFCRLNPQGQSFEDFFGESLSTIDNMIDRAPEGRLEVAGGVLRYMHHCNWKMTTKPTHATP